MTNMTIMTVAGLSAEFEAILAARMEASFMNILMFAEI